MGKLKRAILSSAVGAMEVEEDGTARQRYFFPSDFIGFSGHFPGKPILPGIAQLGMVFDVITHSCGKNWKISNIHRVRFKQIIRPNECVTIIATPMKKKAGAYSFRIMVKEKLACTGIIMVKNR